ncbi:MAG: hypothetical protein AAF481_00825 [Acidobacteriota bacterium]
MTWRNAMVAGGVRWWGPVAVVFAFAAPAFAWTPKTQVVIAKEAAPLAPSDLARQIEKYPKRLEEGVLAPFEDGDAARHVKDPDGGGRLDAVIHAEVEHAIAAIEAHAPFSDIVYQLGRVMHYVADANQPLNASGADPQETRFFADFARYLESAEPRLPVVFYGLRPELEGAANVSPLVATTLARSRALYPMVSREYRRIEFGSGRQFFDDRSTAFGVASLAFSHAVDDAAAVMRYIWLRAGGMDYRKGLPTVGDRVLRLPRATVTTAVPPPAPRPAEPPVTQPKVIFPATGP